VLSVHVNLFEDYGIIMATKENTTINDGPSCRVERFIIIHLGLLPGGLGGSGFDEASSIDELSEYILYYFDSRQSSQYNENESGHRVAYNNESAIRFAGLCHALYSFPSSLSPNKGDGCGTNAADFTKEVQLSTCKLIFIPLERSEVQGLFAVAQCPKQPATSSNNRGMVNPAALREHCQKSHILFKLTKGGGIHGCLSSFDPTVLPSWLMNNAFQTVPSNNNTECVTYPGMEEIYSHHKRLRKLTEKYEIQTSRECFDEIHQTQRIINDLYGFLPINFIRKDLKDFYDWILDQSNTQKRNINLSAFFPPPLAITENMESSQQCCYVVAKMEALLYDNNSSFGGTNFDSNILASHLIGYSAFHRGNHVGTKTRSAMNDIPLQHVHLIYNYLSSYKGFPSVQRSPETDNHHKNYKGFYVSSHESRKNQNYGEEIVSSDLGRVWAPRLFLNYTIPSHAVLYKYHEMSFIFYLHCMDYLQSSGGSNDTNIHRIAATLEHLSEYVDRTVHAVDNQSHQPISNETTSSHIFKQCQSLSSHSEPGLRVIYADRTNDILLFMNGDAQSLTPNTKNNFFILPFLHNNKLHQLNHSNFSNLKHAFDLNISESFQLSLDEMLSEIHFKRGSKRNIQNMSGFELCSLLPNNKWLFGLSDKEQQKEFYAILSADLHFSVADVLQKVNQICASLLE